MDFSTLIENRRKADSATRRLLRRWDGGEAVICHAQAGHKFLHLCVMLEGQRGFLEIRCGDCKFLSGPFRWGPASFELIEDPDHPLDYILSDERNNFSVTCGVVEAEEMYTDTAPY